MSKSPYSNQDEDNLPTISRRRSRPGLFRNRTLTIERIDPSQPIPHYKRDGDAGFDLYVSEDIVIKPFQRGWVSNGIRMNIPPGHEVQIRPRSSTSKMGLDVVLGTVDRGYRGEVKTMVYNNSNNTAYIKAGMRVSQAVLAPVTRANIIEGVVECDTERGEGGFGSTGT